MTELLEPSSGPDWAVAIAFAQSRMQEIAPRTEARDAGQNRIQVERTRAIQATAQSKDTRPEAARREQAKPLFEGKDASGLTQEEQAVVAQLKARDREVRAHEQAHAVVGGAYASAPTYSYQQGPDGNRYAIGGEVQIDVSPVPGDPGATVTKMEVVKAAALAPAEPSAADRQVAAFADAQRAQAIAELTSLRAAERRGEVDRRI